MKLESRFFQSLTRFCRLEVFTTLLALKFAIPVGAQDHTVIFNVSDVGADEIDLVIMPFASEGVFVNGTFTGLSTGAKQMIANGMATARVAKPNQSVILSAGNGPAAYCIA